MAFATYGKPKERFLTGMSWIYLFAFSSLYIQLPGLYGDNGIMPVRLLTLSDPSGIMDFIRDPNLIRLGHLIMLEPQCIMELCVVVGAIISFFMTLWPSFRTCTFYSFLWVLYYSVFKVGQVFLWFQWDIMLLEAGFVTIFVAYTVSSRRNSKYCERIAMWLIRWLLFRLMFSSSVVKFNSGCPTWWGLTALHWHYQSQCIPNPVAWYVHHLPGWFHTLCIAVTLVIEMPLSLLFFVPLRIVRQFSFCSQVFLQLGILLTGNFNFFNLLTIVLCYSLLTDDDFRRKKSSTLSLSNILSLCIIVAVIAAPVSYFDVKVNADYSISTVAKFTKAEYDWMIYNAVFYSIYAAVSLFCTELIICFVLIWRKATRLDKSSELFGLVLIGSVGFLLLFSSLVPFASLSEKAALRLPKEVHLIHNQLKPYQLTNPYGLFRRMTGVGGRPELIIEGAPTESGPWTEYEFRHKPGNLKRIPPVVVPHQPRLDWQMWFAALGSPEHNPWFSNLVYRLLSKESDVLALLNPNNVAKNSNYIRAKLYTYHFSDSYKEKNWWRRSKPSTYLPPVSLTSPSLRSVVESNGLTGRRRSRPMEQTPISIALKTLRKWIGQPADIYPLLLVCIILQVTKAAFNHASNTITQ